MKKQINRFNNEVQKYYHNHKRDLPWRRTKNPYKILVSEVMLQQTQVARVQPKYRVFLKAFPNFSVLSRASIRDILQVWQGLGYNRRALALKKLSEIVMTEYRGKLPEDPELLSELPGIGKATAGAIAAFAFNRPVLFVETNIRRVFLYHFFRGKEEVPDDKIVAILKLAMDGQNPREWYYALMDYGTWLGTFPGNPNRRSAHYAKQSPFHGSNREVRGKILTLLLVRKFLTRGEIAKHLFQQQKRVRAILTHLEQEGFVVKENDTFSLA